MGKSYLGVECRLIVKYWLEPKPGRPQRSFQVTNYDEVGGWRAEGAAGTMARILGEGTVSPAILKDALRYAGWGKDKVHTALAARRQPTSEEQQKGKFGEALHTDLLERFCGMIVPVKKHRFNPAPGASPHGIDIIALGNPEPGGRERKSYAETKLHSRAGLSVLVDAHRSLAKADSADLPSSLLAVMEIEGRPQ